MVKNGSAMRNIYERRAVSGHATAAPPSSMMNSRRFMTGIGFPPTRMLDYTSPATAVAQSVCRISSLPMEGSARVVCWRASGPMSGVGSNPDFLLGGRTSASAESRHWSGRAVRWSSCAILLSCAYACRR